MPLPKYRGYKFQLNKHGTTRQAASKRPEYRHQNQLTEAEVGITESISKSEGFSGIIKARYSDFHVNEINPYGEVAKLTDTSQPEFSMKLAKCRYQDVELSPSPLLPQETWLAIKDLALAKTGQPIYLNVDGTTKEDRKEIYECIRRYFGRKIIVNTINNTDNTSKQMEFNKYNDDTKDIRQVWPEDKGEYVYFLVNKEMLHTVDACFQIAHSMGMNSSKFTYAGTKDKRGITTQWFCVWKVPPWKLLNRTKKLRNIKVGNFSFKDEPLQLGQLKGNKFKIALRNVTAVDSVIEESMQEVKENGFVNYFGLQRFGNNKEVPTYEVGIKLLQGKWQEAVDLILKPKDSDDPLARDGDVANAKKVYAETKDAEKADAQINMSRHKCIEAKLLEGLKKSAKNDYVNALENVPRMMRLLYMHSFQSLIWNKMVSKRLQLFDKEPVEGDLVLIDQNSIDIDFGMAEDETNEDENQERSEEEVNIVKSLTASDLINYTIYDIVLPTPGYKVTYPENMKQYYKEALEELGLSLDMPQQKTRCYTLSGNYRYMLRKVEDFSWKMMYYNEPHADLIRSDYQELKGHSDKISIKDGQYKAVVTEFTLAPCSYATMVLREIMKVDTSTSAHAKLNDYHNTQQSNRIIMGSDSNQVAALSEEQEVKLTSSLLADPAKFAEFQNSIFNDTPEPEKRKTDEEGDHCNKKLKVENNDGPDKFNVEDTSNDENK